MKHLLTFVLGAVLAAAVAVVVVNRGKTSVEPAATPVAEPVPALVPPVAEPASVSEETPVAPRTVNKARKVRPYRPPPARVIAAKPALNLPDPPRIVLASAPGVTNPPALVSRLSTRPLPPPPKPNKVTLIAGTLVTVRLTDEVSTEFNQPGDTFFATLDQPIILDGFIIADRGGRAEGRVMSVTESGRVKGAAELTIRLESIESTDGQIVQLLTAQFLKKADSEKRRDAAKVGVGASIGALIGGIAGGGKGAAIGAAIGGGASTGAVLATKGQPARLESETRITFRLSESVTIVEQI